MPWRAKNRESALRLPGIRRLCSAETISPSVTSGCSLMRARIRCECFSNGEVLPPRGIGSQVPSSRKRCTHLIAELTLTSNCSAASRRDPPPCTKRMTRTLSSPGYGPCIGQPSANQCLRLAPSPNLGNPDSLRPGRAVVTTERTSFARSCGHNMGRWLLGSGSRGLRRPLGRNDDRGCCSMIAVDTCDCPAVDRETSLATPRMRPHRHRSGRSNGMRRAGRNGCARGRRLRADRCVGRDQSFVDARDRSFQSAPCFCQFIRM
jgi:hypothetical protein